MRVRERRDVDDHDHFRCHHSSEFAVAGQWSVLVPIFDFLVASDAAGRARIASQCNLGSD
jgi:hypothetical protein